MLQMIAKPLQNANSQILKVALAVGLLTLSAKPQPAKSGE